MAADALRDRLRSARIRTADRDGAVVMGCTSEEIPPDPTHPTVAASTFYRPTVRRALLKSAGASAAAVVGAGLLAARGNLTGATAAITPGRPSLAAKCSSCK